MWTIRNKKRIRETRSPDRSRIYNSWHNKCYHWDVTVLRFISFHGWCVISWIAFSTITLDRLKRTSPAEKIESSIVFTRNILSGKKKKKIIALERCDLLKISLKISSNQDNFCKGKIDDKYYVTSLHILLQYLYIFMKILNTLNRRSFKKYLIDLFHQIFIIAIFRDLA